MQRALSHCCTPHHGQMKWWDCRKEICVYRKKCTDPSTLELDFEKSILWANVCLKMFTAVLPVITKLIKPLYQEGNAKKRFSLTWQ